jgi:hypothetical protein
VCMRRKEEERERKADDMDQPNRGVLHASMLASAEPK